MRMTDKWVDIILNAVFPNRCALCRELIDREETLCDDCLRSVQYIDAEKRCLACGLEKKNCVCFRNVYHFAGLVAPFYNEGAVHDALMGYKYRNHLSVLRFFAQRVAFCVKNEYRDISFDAVCFAPTSRRSRQKRGFDQSELLAREVAKLLGVPFCEKMLVRKTGFLAKAQHELSVKERFGNVRGTFFCKTKLQDETVLLIDDIKTTGASLDEAARTLLFGGAREVYAAAVAITPPNQKTKKDGDDRGDGHRN